MELYNDATNPPQLRITKLFMFIFISVFYIFSSVLTSYLLYVIYFKPSMLKMKTISGSMKVFFFTNFFITTPTIIYDLYMALFWKLGNFFYYTFIIH